MLIISYDPLHNHWKMCFWQRMLWIYKTLVSFSPGPTQVIFQGSLESHTPICCLVANLCLTETPWTGAHQAPLSMGFPRQEYWNGLPFLSPGALPDPEIEPGSLVLQADLYHLSDQRRPTDRVKWSRSVLSDSATPWTAAHQAPPSMGFSRQEYWSGVPLPSPGDLLDPGIEHASPSLQADTLPSEP